MPVVMYNDFGIFRRTNHLRLDACARRKAGIFRGNAARPPASVFQFVPLVRPRWIFFRDRGPKEHVLKDRDSTSVTCFRNNGDCEIIQGDRYCRREIWIYMLDTSVFQYKNSRSEFFMVPFELLVPKNISQSFLWLWYH